jgi:uncharacterized protein with PIN domain
MEASPYSTIRAEHSKSTVSGAEQRHWSRHLRVNSTSNAPTERKTMICPYCNNEMEKVYSKVLMKLHGIKVKRSIFLAELHSMMVQLFYLNFL